MQKCLQQPLFMYRSSSLSAAYFIPHVAVIKEGSSPVTWASLISVQNKWHAARHCGYSVTWQTPAPCDCHVSLLTGINSLKDRLNKCLTKNMLLFKTTVAQDLRVRSAPLSPAGWGCWISSMTIEPAARQAEGRTKHPTVPPLQFEDGTNWLYKRHQRKVLLRVPITIDSLGGRPGNRKVSSLITAGVQPQIGANGVPWDRFKIFENRDSRVCFYSRVFIRSWLSLFLNRDCIRSAQRWLRVWCFHSQQLLSPRPVFLSLTLHPGRPVINIC